MKILVLEREPSTERGGQELSLFEVCQGLVEKGHEIHLVYIKEGDLLEKYRQFCRSITRVSNFDIDRKNTLVSCFKFLLSFFRALKPKVDLIYLNQYHDSPLGGALAWAKRIPMVCHLRLWPPQPFCGQWRMGLRMATRFIAVSDAVRQAYIQRGFDPQVIVRIYNGFDFKRFARVEDRLETRRELGIPPEAFALLYAGRLDPDKKLEQLIEIYSMLGLGKESGRLVMMGGPHCHPTFAEGQAYVEKLKSLCVAKGIGDQVLWLGRRNDMPSLFGAADTTLLLHNQEAFGRVLVESMACGTPAVGEAKGGIPEILTGEFSRYRIEGDQVGFFVETLKSLVDWRKKDPDLGSRCRAHVERRFSLKKALESIEKELEQVIQKKDRNESSVPQKHVCLISSVHLWVNPRLVKEADTLVENGFKVTVITLSQNDWAAKMDQSLLKTKKWEAIFIDLVKNGAGGRMRWFLAALRSKISARLARWFPVNSRLAEEGYYRGFGRALRRAIECKADLYIAHTQGALPIAVRAARFQHAPYAFDCEDLLAEESADGLRLPSIRQIIVGIESRYLPKAAYVTAASRAIADYLAGQYGIPKPTVVHNVFLRGDLEGVAAPDQRSVSNILKLVWISASIGGGRGLEDAFQALAQLGAKAELHLFGRLLPDDELEFKKLLESLKISSRVHVHPVLEPDKIMKTLSEYDLGLSLDQNDCKNRSLTLSNKFFHYLQAGLAVAATNTPGQREIMEKIPDTGFVYEPGDDRSLARGLANYAADSGMLLQAKNAAWKAGQERYCWEKEKAVFLDSIGKVLE